MPKSKLFNTLAGVSLFLFASGFSYWLFNQVDLGSITSRPSPATTSSPPPKKSKIDPSIPKTETCPLTGALFTKLEQDVWVTRRPLGVMIENSTDARPQSGLSTADIVYEAVAEGGITRFMAMFYCDASLSGNLTIAPVRSARMHYVNLISEYDGLYNHVGGAGNCDDPNVDPRAKALCAIDRFAIKDLDQFGLDFKTCHRLTNRLDKEVAYEHTMACFLDEVFKVGGLRGWTNVDKKGVSWDKNFTPWKFKSADQAASGSPATTISYGFWTTNTDLNAHFNVSWSFDGVTNSYKRTNGGEPATDLNTGDPLAFKNVIVQFAKETALGDLEKHVLYDVIGTGRALVFLDGVAIDATWSKPTRTARTVFKDTKGKEIQFTPGQFWISILPTGNTVEYN